MITSSKPKKQRKLFHSKKPHQLHKDFGANLSKDLRKSLKKRSLSVRKGDKVKIVRGKNKGKTGKIARLHSRKRQVFIEGITRKKADGTEIFVPFHPSNLLLVELSTEDRKRGVKAAEKVKKPETKKEETAGEKKVEAKKEERQKAVAVVKK